ncbi:MAG: hypothetical protein J5794_06260 [Lachnospiraceae bacterium]|nr:hypothetical protein [Lachnospiraceae bacterium]
MFKSKGFTIAFILMSAVIVALSVILGMLVFGQGREALLAGVLGGPNEPQTLVPEPSTSEEDLRPDVRALHLSEEHQYPVLDEELPETGKLTIIIGAAKDGVIFHKLPKFDAATAEGNLVNTSGTYKIVAKVYVYDKDTAYLMYRTEDGYYVTSNTKYVTFKSESVKVLPDSKKKKTYTEESGFSLKVLQEDGNHLAFSVYTDGEALTPFLTDVIASYDAFGTAHFEYKYGSDAYRGTLVFGLNEETGAYKVKLHFDEAILYTGNRITELNLN